MTMPWQKSSILEEKLKFIIDWKKNEFSFSDLCKRYKISRPTGYALLERYLKQGEDGLNVKSSAPHHIPHKTSNETEQYLVDLKYRFPKWGPAKIRDFLTVEKIPGNWPAASTIGEIYKRYGLVKSRKKRKRVVPYSDPLKHCLYPNAVWSVDFKGQFKLKNKTYCYPLTVTDNFSRFLFACDAYESPNTENTIRSFKRIFAEYGLPDAIRSDNGQPFCSLGIGGLTELSIWFIKLGIIVERIACGEPQENGRHERMHRTLKETSIIPEENSLSEQQQKFYDFIYEYNFLRPHSALDGKRPNDIYASSKKNLPDKIPEILYPDRFLIRKVKHNGQIKFAGKKYFVSKLLHGEPLALDMIDEHRGVLYFSNVKLGLIDSKMDSILRPY